jgi:hypothetical protein
MRARWLFRIVERDFTRHYLKVEGSPVMHTGSDHEALIILKRLTIANPNALRIEAVTTAMGSAVPEIDGCLQIFIQPAPDGTEWTLEGDMMHGSQHATVEEALAYAASRTFGCISETSVLDHHGKLTRVILIDATRFEAELLNASPRPNTPASSSHAPADALLPAPSVPTTHGP